MGFSIFASKQTWSSPRSKELYRIEAADEQEMRRKSGQLLQEGYDINGVLPVADEGEQEKHRPRRRR